MASIQGIYLALFGRPADPAGLKYFNGITNGGTDLANIKGLTGTEEYLSRFKGFSNTQVVTAVYKSLFGREPEEGGLKFFVGELDAGRLSIETIAINVLDGAQKEDKATVENKLAASDLFTRSLDTPAEVALYSGMGAAELGRKFLASITHDPATIPAQGQVDAFVATLPPLPITLSVQQVLDGAANGGHYILADRLDKIVAHPDVLKGADSYQLTNATGGVGAVTVNGANVLLGAKNAANFDFSLADSSAAILAASAKVIAEADTIAVLSTGGTVDFSGFSRGVILNGSAGVDVFRGSKFNDVHYGEAGTNTYYSNGGSDTFRLSDAGTDIIFLTGAATNGFSGGPMHIYGWGDGDKFVVNNADFSTNLEGSWTADDLMLFNAGAFTRSDSGALVMTKPMHAVGWVDFVSYAGTDVTNGADFARSFQELTLHEAGEIGFNMGVVWKGFFELRDPGQDWVSTSYIYYVDTGTDTRAAYSEIKLVAVLHDTRHFNSYSDIQL